MEATQNHLSGVGVRELSSSQEQSAAVPVWIRKSDMAMAESVLLFIKSGKATDSYQERNASHGRPGRRLGMRLALDILMVV
jgi:hypothetical protein